MLAETNFRIYLFEWQIPIILAYVAIWWFVGGYLLYRGVSRRDPKRRANYWYCVLAMILCGSSAVICGAIAAYIVNLAGKSAGGNFLMPSLITGAICGLGMLFLVAFAMFGRLSARQTCSALSLPLGMIVILSAVTAIGAGIPAYNIRQRKMKLENSVHNLMRIRYAILKDYYIRFSGPPEKLEELSKTGILDARYFRNPMYPDEEVGYFYLPSQTLPGGSNERIIACEKYPAPDGEGRAAALYDIKTDGTCRRFTNKEFSALLKLPGNKKFAELLGSGTPLPQAVPSPAD